MKEIKLTKNKIAFIDDEDEELIKRYKWYLQSEGYAGTTIIENGKRKMLLMHRLILDLLNSSMDTHHKDHNLLNNCKKNIIICTRQENSRNKIINNPTGFVGVFYCIDKKKFRAQITINYKTIYLGYYCNAENAARVRDKASIKYFGEFAVLNFNDQLNENI